MFCPECGVRVPDGSVRCPDCGAALPSAGQPAAAPRPSPNVELCPDGVYRWIYEFDMKKNPVILLTILKVFGLVCAGLWVLLAILSLVDGDPFLAALWGPGKVILLIFAGFAVLTVPSYLIVSAVNGGRYIVLFEMDEKGVTHTQEPKQFTRAQGLHWLAALAGAALHDPALAGAGFAQATRSGSLRTDFDRVRSMKVLRRWNTVKLNQPLVKNQVYAEKEDFDFVLGFLRDHVPPGTRSR